MTRNLYRACVRLQSTWWPALPQKRNKNLKSISNRGKKSLESYVSEQEAIALCAKWRLQEARKKFWPMSANARNVIQWHRGKQALVCRAPDWGTLLHRIHEPHSSPKVSPRSLWVHISHIMLKVSLHGCISRWLKTEIQSVFWANKQ